MKTLLKAALFASALFVGGAAIAADTAATPEVAAPAEALQGRWDAVLIRNGQEIPFRLDIKGDGPTLEGIFYNGWEAYDGTTAAKFENGKLTLDVEHYLTHITADFKDGQLIGQATTSGRESSSAYTFKATRHVPKVASANAPSIAGTYVIPLATPSSKGEKAFHFIVEQRGAEVNAAILRIDGDTGAYNGIFKDGAWELSHFDGGRPGVIKVIPKADGTLEIRQQNSAPATARATDDYASSGPSDGRYAAGLIAYRPDVAKAKGFAAPDDFLTHTVARDPNEVFKFNFPDENGKLVSNEDPRFKGKVVIAVVTGTWCPNCHDEAQYLAQLDRQYRDKGLAIVALNFEEPEQHKDLRRQRAFIKEYGIKYTYLLAGAPAEMWEKVPQLNHLDTWPATLFIGRDGKIKAVHSGFASPSAGEFHDQLKQQFTSRVETLLAEKVPVTVAAK